MGEKLQLVEDMDEDVDLGVLCMLATKQLRQFR